MTTLHEGTLFRVRIHTEQEGFGFCGNDTPPAAGQAMVCAENYTLVLASDDDVDDDGKLILADGLTSEDVSAEKVEWEVGDHDSDGTATLVCVAPGVFACAV
jgi:hypothetical protein